MLCYILMSSILCISWDEHPLIQLETENILFLIYGSNQPPIKEKSVGFDTLSAFMEPVPWLHKPVRLIQQVVSGIAS